LSERSLLVTDEVSGSGEHSLDLRFVLDPGWRATPVLKEGVAVSCILDGPRWLAVMCEAESDLILSLQPVEISREYGASLASSCILIHTTVSLPARIETRVEWD
jgi:hypothetical protein